MKNKRGWIKVVEAFLAIMLLAGVVLVVIAKQQNQAPDLSPNFRNIETSTLRGVQLNDTLRNEVLSTSGEVEWTSFASQVPKTFQDIEAKTPPNFVCIAKICNPEGPCVSTAQDRSVYVEQIMITSNLQEFNPRMLKFP